MRRWKDMSTEERLVAHPGHNPKNWEDMSIEEKQERLGDPSIDRVIQRNEYEEMLVDRFLAGQPLSRDGILRAKRCLKFRRIN
jgi:hypothetical protein